MRHFRIHELLGNIPAGEVLKGILDGLFPGLVKEPRRVPVRVPVVRPEDGKRRN